MCTHVDNPFEGIVVVLHGHMYKVNKDLSETLLPRWIVLEVICGHRTCGDKLGAGHGKTEGHAEVNRSSQKPARNVLRRSIACLLMQRIKQGAVAYCLGEYHCLVVYSRYRIGLTLMSAGKRKRDVVVGGRWGVKTGWFYTDSVLTGNGMVSEYPGFPPFTLHGYSAALGTTGYGSVESANALCAVGWTATAIHQMGINRNII